MKAIITLLIALFLLLGVLAPARGGEHGDPDDRRRRHEEDPEEAFARSRRERQNQKRNGIVRIGARRVFHQYPVAVFWDRRHIAILRIDCIPKAPSLCAAVILLGDGLQHKVNLVFSSERRATTTHWVDKDEEELRRIRVHDWVQNFGLYTRRLNRYPRLTVISGPHRQVTFEVRSYIVRLFDAPDDLGLDHDRDAVVLSYSTSNPDRRPHEVEGRRTSLGVRICDAEYRQFCEVMVNAGHGIKILGDVEDQEEEEEEEEEERERRHRHRHRHEEGEEREEHRRRHDEDEERRRHRERHEEGEEREERGRRHDEDEERRRHRERHEEGEEREERGRRHDEDEERRRRRERHEGAEEGEERRRRHESRERGEERGGGRSGVGDDHGGRGGGVVLAGRRRTFFYFPDEVWYSERPARLRLLYYSNTTGSEGRERPSREGLYAVHYTGNNYQISTRRRIPFRELVEHWRDIYGQGSVKYPTMVVTGTPSTHQSTFLIEASRPPTLTHNYTPAEGPYTLLSFVLAPPGPSTYSPPTRPPYATGGESSYRGPLGLLVCGTMDEGFDDACQVMQDSGMASLAVAKSL